QSQLRFAIEDTGIAVADGDYDRLFDAFAQGGNEIQQRFGGTDLGLALCRELVQRMGGEISTRALESRGSRFEFTVEVGIAAPLPISSELEGMNILVAIKSLSQNP
ncbi:MAG: ATP-binding protein, partial [Myxococcota bacterium]